MHAHPGTWIIPHAKVVVNQRTAVILVRTATVTVTDDPCNNNKGMCMLESCVMSTFFIF